MGLLGLLKRWLFGTSAQSSAAGAPAPSATSSGTTSSPTGPRTVRRLDPLRHRTSLVRTERETELVFASEAPYHFAHREFRSAGNDRSAKAYLDLSQDGDVRWRDHYGLPHLQTPQDLARWLGLPIGKVAWLTYRFCENRRPQSAKEAH